MKEVHSNIELKKLEILDSHNSEKKSRSNHLDNRLEDFVEIDSELLSESLHDSPFFVLRFSGICGLFAAKEPVVGINVPRSLRCKCPSVKPEDERACLSVLSHIHM